MVSEIQAVLFDKHKWDVIGAEYWLYQHNLRPIKAGHETDNYLRYRIRHPKKFNAFSSKTVRNGIILVIGYY